MLLGVFAEDAAVSVISPARYGPIRLGNHKIISGKAT